MRRFLGILRSLTIKVPASASDHTMPSTYTVPRDRDAYATIRGYVYQVDLTILRWLDLDQGQFLELERGEDIDLVGRALGATDPDEEQRLLEQVKHREENLTLRNPAALEALANAAEHLRANPDIDLRFCYSTNARIGQERPSLFPTRVPALSVWESIRRNDLTGAELAEPLRAIRRFLTRAARPAALNNTVWTEFQRYSAEAADDEIVGFISRFEWSTAQPEAGALGPRPRALLVERDLAADEAEAEQLYERLFLRVFKLLCEAGIKRLTLAALHDDLARPTLSASDHELLVRVRERLRIIERRVDAVEVSVASLTTSVRSMARRQGISGPLTNTLPVPDLGLPPLAPRLSPRESAVALLAAEVGRHSWTALHGGADTGKSHLAGLLARRLGSCCAWIRLHNGMHPDYAGAVLDHALRAVTGLRPSRERDAWYRNVCSRLGGGVLLVVDDLPRLLGNDLLAQRLVQLVAAAHATDVRILSTSLHPVPAEMRVTLGAEMLCEIITPALTELEAQELLGAYGAPQPFLIPGKIRFLNNLASGNPLLLSLAAEYLHQSRWSLDEARLEGLLRGDHAHQLAEDVVAQLVQTLDDARRELLYRLTLPIGIFTTETVMALAAVAPPIARPQECLNDLLGPWVQRDTEARLAVSAVVRTVGAGDLLPQTKVDCHYTLGERIVGSRMTLTDAEVAIGHFLQAREVGQAGTLFLKLLQKVAEQPPSADVRSVVSMWSDLPLPNEMDIGLRLLIRSLQLGVLPEFGRRIDYILDDIDRLLAVVTEEHGWAIAGLAMYGVSSLAATDPDRTLRYLSRALILPEELPGPTEERLSLSTDLHIDDLLWSMIIRIDTGTRLRNWLAAAESLTGPRLERLFQSPLARLGSLVLADRLSVEELRRPPVARRWEDILPSLDQLAQWAIGKRLPLLWACAVRSKVYALGEMGRIDQALVAGQQGLAKAIGDSTAQFLIAGAMARFLVKARRYAEARPLLEEALRQPVHDYPHERMLFLLAASHSYGVEDAEAGVRYAREAVAISQEEEGIPAIELARAYAELAVAQFLQSGSSVAFEAWSEAADRLFAAKEDDDPWKDSFVVFAHTTGYLAVLAVTSNPPSQTRDGSQYAGPERGVFLVTNPERPAYYRQASEPAIMWALAQYAWATGNEQSAARWLARASEAASGTKLTYLQATTARDLIPSLLISDRYEEAVDAGIKACQALLAFQGASREEQDPLGEGLDLDAAVAGMTCEQRTHVERCAVVFAVLPAFLRLAAVAVEDSGAAFSAGRTLAAVCRQVGDRAYDARLWSGAAEILECACRDGATARELQDLSHTFDGQEHTLLRVLGYLASSLHGNIDDAFSAQLATMEGLFAWYPPDSQTHQRLLLTYIEIFWTTAVKDSRFQFRAPSLVEGNLAEAKKAAPNKRVRAILRAVRLGVTARGLDQALRWLDSDPSSLALTKPV